MTILQECFSCRDGNHRGHVSGQIAIRRRPGSIMAAHYDFGLLDHTTHECPCSGNCAERKQERDAIDQAWDRVLEEDERAENEQLVDSGGSTVCEQTSSGPAREI